MKFALYFFENNFRGWNQIGDLEEQAAKSAKDAKKRIELKEVERARIKKEAEEKRDLEEQAEKLPVIVVESLNEKKTSQKPNSRIQTNFIRPQLDPMNMSITTLRSRIFSSDEEPEEFVESPENHKNKKEKTPVKLALNSSPRNINSNAMSMMSLTSRISTSYDDETPSINNNK